MIAFSIIIFSIWFSNALTWQNNIFQKIKSYSTFLSTFKLFNCNLCMSFWLPLTLSLFVYNIIPAITIACLTSILSTIYEKFMTY